MPASVSFPSPRRILLVCTQRIGDVLLATPLAHSLKRAWPEARLDFLVLRGSEGILEGNPDVDEILAFAQRPGWRGQLAQFRRLWRRYDLALAALPTDRARLYAWAAAPRRLGFVRREEHAASKRLLLSAGLPFDDLDTHTVSMGLQLAAALGIPLRPRVQPPRLAAAAAAALPARLGLAPGDAYAVVHPSPKFRYKMWETGHWAALISWLRRQGLRVLLTGSAEAAESAYIEEIISLVPEGAESLAGRLSLAETAELLRRARLFVGPDTVVTHLAAATGVPTLALFGPSNPVKWGPWPQDWPGPQSPWPRQGSGRRGNVWLIQGEGDCVPCLLEGCERHVGSASRCLQEIGVGRVLGAVREILGVDPAG